MEEENNKVEIDLDVTKKDVKKEFSGFFGSLKHFLKELLEIRHDTNKEGTVQQIKDGISMQGHTAWILVFSITIASIGLNANSAAVVIGAMLISPLMGPILGVGLSIGINDIDTLRKSIKNLGVMIGLSLLTSFLFFSIPLFQEQTPEILARTRPDVRDVFIAMAGGLALIVAVSRPSAQTNTVAGVAIATALMPPLCTAGYGLATWNFSFFFGAMFLFTINTIFIALATFVIVKYLRFPMVKYINSARRKSIARLASFLAFIIFAGSIYSFYNLFKENEFKQMAHDFIQELKDEGQAILGEDDENIDYLNRTITLPLLGGMVDDSKKQEWLSKMEKIGLNDTNLNVQQGNDSEIQEQVEDLRDLYSQNQKIITSRDETIKEKEDKIRLLERQLTIISSKSIPFKQVSAEAKIIASGLEELSYSDVIKTNFKSIDTVRMFYFKWYDSIPRKVIRAEEPDLKKWLKTRLQLDTVRVGNK